ncbi:DUF3829 domain-containing protein [Pokkaliibacter sp. CJK22405]|uniref:DUF3829 domain-containing protein n=1 Tax=Pokkaliibacter sp. CJK22405 TaxID=3384615 RepID=UPI003984A3F7
MSTRPLQMLRSAILPLAFGFTLSLGLTACGGDDEATPAAAQQTSQSQADQQEIMKYNTYIDAANQINTSFSQELAEHIDRYSEPLKQGKKLSLYSVPLTGLVDRVNAKLKEAMAMPAAMDDLDPVAKRFSEALSTLAPLNSELENYANSKGYLSDDSAKARDMDASYVAALTAVAEAEQAFFNGLEERDQKNLRDAFEQATPGTSEYFRAGMIVRARDSLKAGDEFFASQGSTETAAAFKTSLDKVAEMSDGWSKMVRENNGGTVPATCNSVTSQVNFMVSAGRDAIQSAERGNYKIDPNDLMTGRQNTMRTDASRLQHNYNNLVAHLNNGGC